MTNGENLKNIYPNLEIICEIKDVYVIMLEAHNVWSPKLEVFKSWWNAEYKEPKTKDCLAVEHIVDEVVKRVAPIRPKGRWCPQNDDYYDWYECSECGYGSEGEMQCSSDHDVRTNYCPYCGADMREVEE